MFAIARFRVEPSQHEEFLERLRTAHDALKSCAGYLSGEIGLNTDEPRLIALVTRWENIGSYRRALSNFQVKVDAVPVLAQAIDEPGGYVGPNE
ncbi:MAG: antibiotic biosynthesis monooxygenase family protein [Candidatus Nanopelagicaceae bacterium]